MGWAVLGGLFLIAIGLVMFFKPKWVWKLTEQWKSDWADEPSDLYVLSTKIGGVLFMLGGVAVIVGSLVLLNL